MLGLRHLALNVVDIQKSTDFYVTVLGMKIEWQPDADNVYLTTGSDNLALHKVAKVNRTHSPLDHLGFLLSTPEEVDQWAAKIKKLGYKLSKEPKTHRDGARSFYFTDPEGNLIQMIFHPPISKAK